MINNNNNAELKDSLLPPPEILVKYKEIGIGEDIIEIVKKEQEHRHALQKKYQINYRMGQLFGFLICALIVINIFNLITSGHKIEAYILLVVFSILVLSINAVTRNKTKIQRKNTIQKRLNQQQQKRKKYR